MAAFAVVVVGRPGSRTGQSYGGGGSSSSSSSRAAAAAASWNPLRMRSAMRHSQGAAPPPHLRTAECAGGIAQRSTVSGRPDLPPPAPRPAPSPMDRPRASMALLGSVSPFATGPRRAMKPLHARGAVGAGMRRLRPSGGPVEVPSIKPPNSRQPHGTCAYAARGACQTHARCAHAPALAPKI